MDPFFSYPREWRVLPALAVVIVSEPAEEFVSHRVAVDAGRAAAHTLSAAR
jgi:hypothetical protein